MVDNLVGINLHSCSKHHKDKRTLPQTVFYDTLGTVLPDQFMLSGMQNKLLPNVVDESRCGVQSKTHTLSVCYLVLKA